MYVSLEQAIEMHAEALRRRDGQRAPNVALEKARRCKLVDDHEGYVVWSRVAATANALLTAGGTHSDSAHGE